MICAVKSFFIALLCCVAFAQHQPLQKADKVLILKKAHTLQLLQKGQVIKTYQVALGPHIEGAKQQEGDGKTPEGTYKIDYRNAHSAFYKSLHISYPNPQDIAAAKVRGVSPGGMIMIHGIQNGLGWLGSLHRKADWTNGCIAVTDQEIDEIWSLVPDGTPVEIRP
jgi:murein L,D-transpeptidase YafK